jgi:hypothetical protein
VKQIDNKSMLSARFSSVMVLSLPMLHLGSQTLQQKLTGPTSFSPNESSTGSYFKCNFDLS